MWSIIYVTQIQKHQLSNNKSKSLYIFKPVINHLFVTLLQLFLQFVMKNVAEKEKKTKKSDGYYCNAEKSNQFALWKKGNVNTDYRFV